mmetsp:Transcript_15315/g.42197  ORF Transcript_15315/g.42197 Transcript_15315/m.42197 type:complete len:240 (+) Transcript_15315:125-844(+)
MRRWIATAARGPFLSNLCRRSSKVHLEGNGWTQTTPESALASTGPRPSMSSANFRSNIHSASDAWRAPKHLVWPLLASTGCPFNLSRAEFAASSLRYRTMTEPVTGTMGTLSSSPVAARDTSSVEGRNLNSTRASVLKPRLLCSSLMDSSVYSTGMPEMCTEGQISCGSLACRGGATSAPDGDDAASDAARSSTTTGPGEGGASAPALASEAEGAGLTARACGLPWEFCQTSKDSKMPV